MKKIPILSVIVFSIVIVSQANGFAATCEKNGGSSYMRIKGTIESIDKRKLYFVIKDKDDGRRWGLNAWSADLDSLNQGDHVEVSVPWPGQLASRIIHR